MLLPPGGPLVLKVYFDGKSHCFTNALGKSPQKSVTKGSTVVGRTLVSLALL